MRTEECRDDHVRANKKAPIALLTNDHDHAAAKKLVESEAPSENGEAAGGCKGMA
jgi:hypothetical protein